MNHQPQPRDGQIVSLQAYRWPQFPSEANERVTFSAASYYQVSQDQSYCLQRVSYLSDGLEVIAYLYRPATIEGEKLPAIVYNRGGYLAEDPVWLFGPFFYQLASAGFLVIAPQLRESEGGEGRSPQPPACRLSFQCSGFTQKLGAHSVG